MSGADMVGVDYSEQPYSATDLMDAIEELNRVHRWFSTFERLGLCTLDAFLKQN